MGAVAVEDGRELDGDVPAAADDHPLGALLGGGPSHKEGGGSLWSARGGGGAAPYGCQIRETGGWADRWRLEKSVALVWGWGRVRGR